jgi:gliding motility-associated-like protein
VLDDKELPVITLVSTDNTICVGTPDGTASLSSVTYQGATVNAPSAFAGYSFNWSSSETTQSISNKAAAFYSLEVTRDDVGCTSDIVSIEVKDDLVIPAILLTSTPQTSCDPANLNGQSDAAVDVGGIPTTAGFNYRWFAGTDTTSLLNPINIDPVNSFTAIDLPGNVFYTVKITNATTRCENTRSIFLQEIIAIPRIELVPTDVTDCNTPGFVTANVFIDTNNDGIEEPLAPGDYVNYQFSWFRGSSITDPQLINTTTRLLQFLDDGITPIPVQNYTAFVVNTLTSCAAADVTTLINGPGPLFDIDVNVNFAPASCATNDGVITAFIDVAGVPTTAGFTFEWHQGSITNGLQVPPPSFYTDPPVAFTLPVLDVDPLGFFGTVTYPIGQPLPNHQAPTSATTGPTLYGRPSGTFTIVATRNADGCKEYLTAFLPFQAEPVIIVADIVPDDCLGDNGSIGVDITVPVPNTPSDYKVWLIPGTNPTLTPGLPPPVFSGVVDPALAVGNLFPNLGPGIYTVVAQEDPLDIASGCFSSPVQVEMREALPPLLEVLAASFSTSCGVAPGDGSMQITFETDPSDPFNPAFPPPPPPINFTPGPQSYTVDVVDQSSANIFSVGGFASGSIVNIPNLQNGDFDVTITSSQGCTITKTFTVPANPQVAELVDGDVITQNALFCNPVLEANARVEITNIAIVGGPADNFGDYRFDWFTDLALSANVYNDIGDPTAAAGGEIFENNINGVAPGTVIEGSYWIVATKVNAGATGGLGCFSAPFKVDILDDSEDPLFTLTPFSNTACDANFEGSLTVLVTDPGSVASPTYTYDWAATNPIDIEGGGGPIGGNDGDGSGADADGDNPLNLQDGTYQLTVVNDVTGCFTTGQSTILKTTVPVIIATATPVNQLICNPDGSITVNDVTVGGVIDPVHTNFDFSWYVTDPNSAPVINALNGVDVLNIGNLPTIGAGTYYVKARRIAGLNPGSGCESAQLRVDILDDSEDPLFTLTPFSNTACDANFEGSLTVLVTDPGSVASPTYTYDWAATNPIDIEGGGGPIGGNDGDGSGADADGDNPLNLQDGTYQLTVVNDVTGCSTTGQSTITKTTVPVIIATATPVNQLICNPDGSITVNDVTVGGVIDPVHTNFDFSWYITDPNSAPVINAVNGVDVLNVGNLPTIGAGTYYVKARRIAGLNPGSGCESAQLRVDILDDSEDPLFTLTPFSNTACDANFEGSLTVLVTDPGSVASPTYTYDWAATNPIDIEGGGGPIGGNDGDGSGADADGDNPLNLQDGTYQLTVVNDVTGCSTTGQSTITKTTVPVIIATATPVNQLICNPDGSITVNDVTVGGVIDPVHTNFDFSWYITDPNSAPVINAVNGVDVLNVGNLPTIGAGTYYVKARRIAGLNPGSGCESAQLRVDILDDSEDPLFTLTPFSNTACDANFEGSLTVLVTDPGSVASPTYTYDWAATNPIDIEGGGGPIGGNDGDGSGADADGDNPLNLQDGTYQLTVVNDVTGCFTTGQSTILKTTVPVIIATATPVNQLICNPDGSITVNDVTVGGVIDPVHTNFDFSWYITDPNSAPVINAVNGVDVLNVGNLPTIGAGTYYVKARRIAGLNPGSGCESAQLRVDILDLSEDPDVSFVFAPNTSCNPANPNGSIIATAVERDATTDVYTFNWTHNGGVLPGITVQADATPVSQLTSAFEGDYVLSINNTLTGCNYAEGVTIDLDQTVSLPNIVNVLAVDPIDCFPTGSAQVVEITIGGTTTLTDPPDDINTTFDFEWYKGSFPGGLIAGQTNSLLPGQLPDTYFVLVEDLTTNCQSQPVQVVIDTTSIVYPDIQILQTLPQVSCDALVGTAALVSTADGQDDTNVNYTFTWYPSLDASGASFANTSTITNLVSGDYSVEVLNVTTNCQAASFYIIPDNAPQFLPQLSLSTTERTRCDLTDGSLLSRGVPYPVDPLEPLNNYPFPYNYTSELFVGPDVTGVSLGFMANDPLNPTFTSNFLQTGLAEGKYTVRLTDLNTSCVVVDTISVRDGRVLPVIVIVEDNPLTNCDPLRANGQLSATADGGLVGGYSFEWYSGPIVAGPILSSNNKLIGQLVGPYTVFVTNNLTGCFSDETGDITDATVLPPAPTALLVQPRTSCLVPNGWVTANVNGETLLHRFDWYDGSGVSGSPDSSGPDYTDLDVLDYTVTATDLVTGCTSPGVVIAVPDARVYPLVNPITTPSYCLTPSGSAIIELTPEYSTSVLTDIEWFDENGNSISVGPAAYELPAGTYSVVYTSSEGCVKDTIAVVGTEILSYNLVSVNSDGRNDVWIIDCLQNFPSNNVKVFNRSGVLVYEANGYNNVDVVFSGIGEKGVYAFGNELPDGTYFYIIDKRDGSKAITGYLELVR